MSDEGLDGTARAIVSYLREHEGATTHDVGEVRRPDGLQVYYDIAHGRLTRLAKRGLVERLPGRPARWKLTRAGEL